MLTAYVAIIVFAQLANGCRGQQGRIMTVNANSIRSVHPASSFLAMHPRALAHANRARMARTRSLESVATMAMVDFLIAASHMLHALQVNTHVDSVGRTTSTSRVTWIRP